MKIKNFILSITLFFFAAISLSAQSLPEKLQDLPPELSLSSLSDSSMEKLKTNAYIFLGGVLLNAAGFFYDWAGAERVIDYQKSKVLYKYGLFKNYGGYNEDSLIQYIRKLLLQDNNRLKSQLEHSLITYIKTYPWGKYTGEAEYYLASFYKREDKYNEALIHSIRQIYLYPEFSLTPIAKQRVINLTVENSFMELFPKSKKKDIILLNIAKQAEKIRDYNLAIKIYTEIANIHSDTSLARKAILRLADIFYTHINDKKLANYYYNELIESYPSSKEAKIAKEKLK